MARLLIIILALLSLTAATHEVVICTRVIDGDTIELSTGERVRYIGMDTEEPGSKLGEAIAQFNKKMVEGKVIRLEFDKELRDRYGRLLAYVYADDVFINALMVRWGLAKVMTVKPNVRYKEYFLQLQREAKEEGVGIWVK
ncbi:MAG: thermonuclease family protein [Candidatus Brocadiales bacterium]